MVASVAPRLAMVAGEVSGDLLAGLLLQGLRARWPGLTAAGIGGPRMQSHGFEPWWPHDKLAVRGYVEVLKHYREILGIRRRLAERLLHEPPDCFIGVDAPDFNLELEAQLKRAHVKTVHFICPSFWAWRGERAARLARSADHVLCVFPFEPELLKQHGVAATYVGHPLADAIPLIPPREAARKALGIADSEHLVALLPGSRKSEITSIAPVFFDTAARLYRERSTLRFVLPAAPALGAMLEPLRLRHAPDVPIHLLEGRSHEALAACDVTLIASGTATLEAALFKRPMVIAYRMNAISWQMMKRMRYQPWIGLPNILCREWVVPERLQGEATATTMAADVLAWLDAPARAEALAARFTELHHLLRRDTARTATDAIAKVLETA
ncbi:MAG: lipid-A-disaccharide synthase [Burkholderiaceae bacterium]